MRAVPPLPTFFPQWQPRPSAAMRVGSYVATLSTLDHSCGPRPRPRVLLGRATPAHAWQGRLVAGPSAPLPWGPPKTARDKSVTLAHAVTRKEFSSGASSIVSLPLLRPISKTFSFSRSSPRLRRRAAPPPRRGPGTMPIKWQVWTQPDGRLVWVPATETPPTPPPPPLAAPAAAGPPDPAPPRSPPPDGAPIEGSTPHPCIPLHSSWPQLWMGC